MLEKVFYEFSPFLLDPEQRALFRDGERVSLHPKTFLILQVLIEADGRVVTKDDLLTRVWPDVVVEESNLTKNISLLRKTLDNGSESSESGESREFIETIPKIGYRFRAEVIKAQSQNGHLKPALIVATRENGQRRESATETKADALPASVIKQVWQRWLWKGLAAGLICGAGLIWWKWPRSQPTVTTATDEFAPVRLTHHLARDLFPAYSPDGKKIAFTSNRDGLLAIYVMNPNGSDVRRITSDSLDCHFPYWSADGTKILFTARGATGSAAGYEVNTDGSGLANRPNFFITLSPDGKRTVFVKEFIPGSKVGHEIFVANADGSNEARLTNNRLLDADPSWSPDGKRIAFTCFPDGFVDAEPGNAEICAIDANGKNWVRLTNNSARDQAPIWSPDGTRIAFHSSRDCASREALYVMNADGSNAMRLTECQNFDGLAGWSPDSKRLVYASDHDGNTELYSINADPSHQTNLTHHPAEDSEPTWSPDGKHIAFISNRDGKGGLFVMDADSANLRKLAGDVISPLSWAPDGQRVVFGASWSGSDDIYAANADGSHIIQLTHNPEHENWPVWSPDGKKVLYFSDIGGVKQLHVMNADGSGVTRISNSSEHEWMHDWSPDGKQIVFTRSRNCGVQRDIWMMNADGSNAHPIAFAPGTDEFANPRFSPDGGRIAFQRRVASPLQTDIWVMNADGSGQARLTYLGGNSPAWSPDGKKITFHSGKRKGNAEIYVMDVAGR